MRLRRLLSPWLALDLTLATLCAARAVAQAQDQSLSITYDEDGVVTAVAGVPVDVDLEVLAQLTAEYVYAVQQLASIGMNDTDLGDTYQYGDDYESDGCDDGVDLCPFTYNVAQYDDDGG